MEALKNRIFSLIGAVCMAFAVYAQSTVVFDFKSLSDASGQYTGTLQNGATLTTLGTHGVLSLGANNGYLDLGESFGSMVNSLGTSFTISVDVYVPTSSDISKNGNFIWCFSKSSSSGYMFLNAKQTRYAITEHSYQNETSVNPAKELPKGEWVNIMYVQDGATGTVYLNNVQQAQNTSMVLFPSALTLTNNYLGRSCYSGDAYLKDARYADFRVYDTALSNSNRAALVTTVTELNLLEEGIATEADAVEAAMAAVSVPMVAYRKIDLPTVGKYGTQISWSSDDPSHLTADGTVVRQETNSEVGVGLTATFTLGNVTRTKYYAVSVKPKEEYKHYLFAFFPSNSDENIYFAVGEDGYNYTTINNDQPVFSADGHTVMGGLRDPHILRGKDGFFYMVATDMRSAMGWSSNRGIVLMKSNNLIDWTCSQVHFPTRYAGTYLENVTRVWAPETIYDHREDKYMVYFSILTNDGTVTYDKVYYAYANADFTDLEGEPVFLYDRGSATIDMDIVYNEADALYHGFYKNEGSGGICKVTAESLTAPVGQEGSQWSAPSGTLQQTTEAVEGAGVFRLINDDQWILMYDCYNNGHYQFCSSPDLTNFTFEKNTATSGSFTPRHGTVLPVTEAEYQALLTAFPCESITGEITPDSDGNLNLTAERISQLCENTDGWNQLSGFQSHSDSRSYTNGEAEIKGTWVERWKNKASIGSNLASKTLRYLPAGTYKLRASCIASWQSDASVTVSGVTLFADEQTADVHTANGTPELYTLTFDIQSADDYTTALGMQTTAETTANWVAFDNFRLYFVGSESDYHTALRTMHDDYIARAEAVYAQLYIAFQPELRAAIDAVDPDETQYDNIVAQLDALQAAVATAQQRIDETLLLHDNDSQQSAGSHNADLIGNASGQKTVVLVDRTLWKDGCWNTLCLPFEVSTTDSPLAGDGVQAMTLNTSTSGLSGSTLTLKFDAATTIPAGTPFLVKWDNTGANIDNPTFTGVTIDNSVTAIARKTANSTDGNVSFIGSYAPVTLPAGDQTKLYFGEANTLYYPSVAVTLNAFRAYFHLNSSSPVKDFVLSFGEEPTLISLPKGREASDDAWYDLQGRKIKNEKLKMKNGSALPRGIYIHNGKKVVIK